MVISIKGWREWLKLRHQEMELQSFAVGMNSTVDFTEDRHIVMLDYDIKDLKRVEESVKELILFWGLSDFFIFKTRNGHHAIGWYDIIPYSRLRMIIDYAKDCDPMFRYISRYYSHKTLRVAGKYREPDITFCKVIKGIRQPSEEEIELGELKRQEHAALVGLQYEVV